MKAAYIQKDFPHQKMRTQDPRESRLTAKTGWAVPPQNASLAKEEGLDKKKKSQAWSVPHTFQWSSKESHLGNVGRLPADYLTEPETKPDQHQCTCSHKTLGATLQMHRPWCPSVL